MATISNGGMKPLNSPRLASSPYELLNWVSGKTRLQANSALRRSYSRINQAP